MRTRLAALLALFLTASAAWAGTLAGVTLPDKADADGQALVHRARPLRAPGGTPAQT